MTAEHVVVLYNSPSLAADHPDYLAEAGVLDAVEAVDAALAASGRQTSRLAVDDCASLGARLARLAPEVVFNLFEGFDGGGHGQAQVAGLIELLGYPLTGAPSMSLALTQDKARCNWLLRGAGVATPDSCLCGRDAAPDRAALESLLARGPVIVKPAAEDASLGISSASVTASVAEARRQAESLAEQYGDVLIEQFVDGREFNVAIVGWPAPRVLPLAEIEFDGRLAASQRVVTYEAKWSPNSAADLATPVRCPVEVEPELGRRIRASALAAYRLTGCRDYARIDLRVDHGGAVFVLDVNNNCDISPEAGLSRAVRAGGQSHAEFVAEVATAARARGPAGSPIARRRG